MQDHPLTMGLVTLPETEETGGVSFQGCFPRPKISSILPLMTTRANVEACPEGMEGDGRKGHLDLRFFVIKNRYILNYDPKMCFEKNNIFWMQGKHHSKGEEDSCYSPSLRFFFPSPPDFAEKKR